MKHNEKQSIKMGDVGRFHFLSEFKAHHPVALAAVAGPPFGPRENAFGGTENSLDRGEAAAGLIHERTRLVAVVVAAGDNTVLVPILDGCSVEGPDRMAAVIVAEEAAVEGIGVVAEAAVEGIGVVAEAAAEGVDVAAGTAAVGPTSETAGCPAAIVSIVR